MSQSNCLFNIIHLNEIDSTITYLKRTSKNKHLVEFTTVLADYQTAGYGQQGNFWESEAHSNLLFSFILYPDFCQANQQFCLSQMISIAIKETLEKYVSNISIKWPNDIYWKDKKICGILIDQDIIGTKIDLSIIGIGVNINQPHFKSNAPNPISLFQITGKKYNLQEILIDILLCTKNYYKRLIAGDNTFISQKYFNSLYRRNGYYPYYDREGKFMARIKKILPSGNLILIDQNGKERSYQFKEVSFKKQL